MKINMLNLKGSIVKMKAKSGELECLVLPINLNNFYRGEKGIYLDMIAFEIRNPKPDQTDTHIIKQSLPKEVRETMSEEEQKAQPILGNMRLSAFQGSEAVSSSVAIEEDDGLPF